jgi:DNA-binding response OmpR family regulator
VLVIRPLSRRYTRVNDSRESYVSEIGILIVDDDIASQRALKNVLDSEGWRVRIVPLAAHAMAELATGSWNLVIADVAIASPQSALFATLAELSRADEQSRDTTPDQPSKRIRALFLVPPVALKTVQPCLEREGLPYSIKPYHLNDFLERVSELLVEAGAITEPIRAIGGFAANRRRPRDPRRQSDGRRTAMFASREDYHMTEEEMAEFERQEQEESRKKREKELKDRLHR